MINSAMKKFVGTGLLSMSLALGVAATAQADLPSPLQSKVENYKKKLSEWAANPVVIKAIKESNARSGLASGMSNAKWDQLSEKDPIVAGFQSSEAGKIVSTWEQDKAISKLYLRDEKGNLVAASNNKPSLYNVSDRPVFINGLKGPWAAAEVKPDPTTKINSVQVSVPVLEGGKVIGVIQTAVVAE
ncbi:MAG: GAF domain-containing protein [Pseudomonadota bacterium]